MASTWPVSSSSSGRLCTSTHNNKHHGTPSSPSRPQPEEAIRWRRTRFCPSSIAIHRTPPMSIVHAPNHTTRLLLVPLLWLRRLRQRLITFAAPVNDHHYCYSCVVALFVVFAPQRERITPSPFPDRRWAIRWLGIRSPPRRRRFTVCGPPANQAAWSALMGEAVHLSQPRVRGVWHPMGPVSAGARCAGHSCCSAASLSSRPLWRR